MLALSSPATLPETVAEYLLVQDTAAMSSAVSISNLFIVVSECSCDYSGDFLKLLGSEFQLLVAEVEVALCLQGNEVNVGVRNLHTKHSDTYALAGDGCLDGSSHLLCEGAQAGVSLIVEVENVIHLFLGNNQGMPLGKRIDVEESIVVVVFSNLVRRYLPCGNL